MILRPESDTELLALIVEVTTDPVPRCWPLSVIAGEELAA